MMDYELEMNQHQRGLVNNCFEEGQNDAAIAILEQLRCSTYKPSPSHVRQLIYISLQPALEPAENDKSYLESPSKLAKQRQSFSISASAVLAARRLLMSFVTTNSPEALGRALPHYPDINNPIPVSADDDADSIIGKSAICVKNSKNCWSILMEGFTLRTKQIFSSPKGKGKKRRDAFADDLLSTDAHMLDDAALVGEDAWPVLDWLLHLFERDESLTEKQGLIRHSPLLIHQLPPPRSGTGARWDTSAPLGIAFHCFEQSDLRRQRMGIRLMTLLINLSSTAYLDLPMFVASVFSRLSSSGEDGFLMLFSNLAPSPSVRKFKVGLCQKLITDTALSPGSTRVNIRPKPQARAQPRALRARLEADQSQLPDTSQLSEDVSLPSKHSLPSWTEIMPLMESDISGPLSPPATKSLLLRSKFELLFSYGFLQAQDPSAEWTAVVADGNLATVLENAFDSDVEGRIYGELLRSTMNTR